MSWVRNDDESQEREERGGKGVLLFFFTEGSVKQQCPVRVSVNVSFVVELSKRLQAAQNGCSHLTGPKSGEHKCVEGRSRGMKNQRLHPPNSRLFRTQ